MRHPALASAGPYAETMAAEWAAWDDSTITAVGALAHTSLRSAVVSTVSSSAGGGDAVSPDDAWRDLSDLTPVQTAWLAAEEARGRRFDGGGPPRMGGRPGGMGRPSGPRHHR